jgi:hypothetical protein
MGGRSCHGLALTTAREPVSALLKKHAAEIERMESLAAGAAAAGGGGGGGAGEEYSKVFYLRYCLDAEAAGGSPGDEDDRDGKLKESLAWRRGAGRGLCEAARAAVARAADGGGAGGPGRWDNGPVLDAAPHASRIRPFLTPAQAVTTALDATGDLLYCVRAGRIDDNRLLSEVSADDLVDFFLYVKEVHRLAADRRSLETDRLVRVVTANDLAGVPLVGGSAEFRKALGRSSKLAASLYPASLSGPTLLLNLPRLLGALVRLFTPLFPPAVNARLKFADCPSLSAVESLTEVSGGGPRREAFQAEIRAALGL